MRVCHLGKYYPPAPGGMESHVQALAAAQAELGASVSVICVNHENRRCRDVNREPFASTPTVRIWDNAVHVTRLGRRASLARFDVCPGLMSLMDQFRSKRVDLIHLHVPNPTMLLALALQRPSMPLVISYQSDVVRQRVLKLALRPLERFVFATAAKILSSSPSYPLGSAFLKKYRQKLDVLPLGIDLEPYLRPNRAALAFARELELSHGSPLWLGVGRLVYYKGFPNALRALKSVPGKLILIGTGPLEASLRRLAKELGVDDRILWMGYRTPDEVVGAYHAATALWFPSNARSEAFGLVQVEAMASGCPVINTLIPGSGVTWVSRHEETGLTVPMNDPEALARAARRLLTESGLRERLGAGARARACSEFDQKLMARRCLSIYHGILAGERSNDALLPRKSA